MMTKEEKDPLEKLHQAAREAGRRRVEEEIALITAKETAKEAASKYIGKHAVPWIVLLVALGVGASYFLDASTLPAVIGLVSTSVMALIAMVTGITGTKEKEEKPEFLAIRDLIARLDKGELPMKVSVEGDRVVVSHGDNVVAAARARHDQGELKLEMETSPEEGKP